MLSVEKSVLSLAMNRRRIRRVVKGVAIISGDVSCCCLFSVGDALLKKYDRCCFLRLQFSSQKVGF